MQQLSGYGAVDPNDALLKTLLEASWSDIGAAS
jgi:hypothetical protein